MSATISLAIMVLAWAIVIVYMTRPGGGLHLDPADASRDARSILRGGGTIKFGYYKLRSRTESTLVADADLEQILSKFGTPAAHRAEVVNALHGNVAVFKGRNISSELLTNGQFEKIRTLSVECHVIREFGRQVEIDRSPLDLRDFAYA